MRDRLAGDVKAAMKAGDKARLSTLRLVQAAVKDRDIANRGIGKEAASDDEIVQLLAKMVKQREESAKAFDDGGRPELAAKERAEIEVIREFLPRQMDEAQAQAAIRAAIAETGAAGVKDMGKVMAALREKYVGQMDFGRASAGVRALLSGGRRPGFAGGGARWFRPPWPGPRNGRRWRRSRPMRSRAGPASNSMPPSASGGRSLPTAAAPSPTPTSS